MGEGSEKPLAVFVVFRQTKCADCGATLEVDDFVYFENRASHCLACADLDHLVFLPSGDMALSRRARLKSPLNALVFKFSRSRKRNERVGVLVTEEAISKAEEECAADEQDRAARRVAAEARRKVGDQEYCRQFKEKILELYPRCSAEDALRIAEHTTRRHSGRIGRTSFAKSFDSSAIDLAVYAHIRHAHTAYDELLMRGVSRDEARSQIQARLETVAARWRNRA